jgi:hypothetical protein
MSVGRKLSAGQETVEQRRAFEEYCKMGDERSLVKIAKLMNKAPLTVQRWSKIFDWRNKVIKVDQQHIDTANIESIADHTDSRKRNLKLIDVMLKDAAIIDENGNIVESKVKLKSMTDIRTALEVREALLGRDKTGKSGDTTNIDKAVFIIKKG